MRTPWRQSSSGVTDRRDQLALSHTLASLARTRPRVGREVVVLQRRARLCGGSWSFHTWVCLRVWVCVGCVRASERRARCGLAEARPQQNPTLCLGQRLPCWHYGTILRTPPANRWLRVTSRTARYQGFWATTQSRGHLGLVCLREKKQSQSPPSPACAPSSVSKNSFFYLRNWVPENANGTEAKTCIAIHGQASFTSQPSDLGLLGKVPNSRHMPCLGMFIPRASPST